MSKLPVAKIESSYSPNYRKINVNRVIGGLRPRYFELDIISEETDFKDVLASEPIAYGQGKEVFKRTIECKLIMDAVQAKALLKFLMTQVEQYEQLIGKIPSNEEIVSNIQRSQSASS